MADDKKTETKTELTDASTAQDNYNKEARYTLQDLDQERANTKRAREEADALAEAVSTAQDKLDKSQAKIVELEEQIKAQVGDIRQSQNELDDMESEFVPASVRKNIEKMLARQNKLEQLLDAEKQERSALQAKVTTYEQTEAEKAEERRKAEARERILKFVEEEDGLGPQYRNAALKLADDWVDAGKEKQPAGALDAIKLMRKAYNAVAAKQDKSTKPSVPSDTGESGVTPTGETALKDGSLDDVLEQMKKHPETWKTSA